MQGSVNVLAHEGQVVMLTLNGEDRLCPVRPRCHSSSPGRMYCVAHGLGFTTEPTVGGHAFSGEHKWVWWCLPHGAEQVDSLMGAAEAVKV